MARQLGETDGTTHALDTWSVELGEPQGLDAVFVV